MQCTVRDADKKDAKAISRLFVESWRDTYAGSIDRDYLDSLNDDNWTKFLRGGIGRGLIVPTVWDGDRLVGAAVARASEIQRYPEDGELACLYLLPGYTGLGLGKRLLDSVEASLREQGFAHCALDVLDANIRARRFYERNGFEITPYRVNFSLGANNYCCYLMRKALVSSPSFFADD